MPEPCSPIPCDTRWCNDAGRLRIICGGSGALDCWLSESTLSSCGSRRDGNGGVGRTLMKALTDVLRSEGVDHVVLECPASRVALYQHCGFQVVDEFADPAGPDLHPGRAPIVSHISPAGPQLSKAHI